MTFQNLKRRNQNRFAEVVSFLHYVKTLEPENIQTPQSTIFKISKGLAYVHLYGAIEKSVNDIVATSLLEISSFRPSNKHVKSTFLNISAFPKMKAYRDCSIKKQLQKSKDVFDLIESLETCTIDETMFQYFLQNIHFKKINDVLRTFDIGEYELTPLDVTLFDGITENRNKVAHGRESAAEVGERITCDKLLQLHDLALSVIDVFADKFENYSLNLNFIRPHFKQQYTVTAL